ncbi:hypothetical protein EK546_09455 [Salmonella enterica]|nr:hypothetical protein [Salmonella enterica]
MYIISIIAIVIALAAIVMAIVKTRKAKEAIESNSAKLVMLQSRDTGTKQLLEDPYIPAETKLIKLKNLHGVA